MIWRTRQFVVTMGMLNATPWPVLLRACERRGLSPPPFEPPAEMARLDRVLAWARRNGFQQLPNLAGKPPSRAERKVGKRIQPLRPRRIVPGSRIVVNPRLEAAWQEATAQQREELKRKDREQPEARV